MFCFRYNTRLLDTITTQQHLNQKQINWLGEFFPSASDRRWCCCCCCCCCLFRYNTRLLDTITTQQHLNQKQINWLGEYFPSDSDRRWCCCCCCCRFVFVTIHDYWTSKPHNTTRAQPKADKLVWRVFSVCGASSSLLLSLFGCLFSLHYTTALLPAVGFSSAHQ